MKKQEINRKIEKLHDEKTLLLNDIAILYEKNRILLETWKKSSFGLKTQNNYCQGYISRRIVLKPYLEPWEN